MEHNTIQDLLIIAGAVFVLLSVMSGLCSDNSESENKDEKKR